MSTCKRADSKTARSLTALFTKPHAMGVTVDTFCGAAVLSIVLVYIVD